MLCYHESIIATNSKTVYQGQIKGGDNFHNSMYCSKAWTTQLPWNNQKNDEQTYVMSESFATFSQGWKMLDKVLHNSKSKNLHLQHIEIKEYSEDF